MDVEVAHHSGFCYGVKEAIKLATETADGADRRTVTFGPLIHNPQEIDRLSRDHGIERVDSLDGLTDANVVIRAHGVPPEEFDRAAAQRLTVVDATCRFVTDVQRAAIEFCRKGYPLYLVGEPTHPEVIGIVGHARREHPDAEIHVVESVEDIIDARPERAGIVFQTTHEYGKYKHLERHIRANKLPWKIKNTICGATKSNQYAADELARRVDVMVVIGGKNSGNTRRLVELCAEHAPSHHIETAVELNVAWFSGAHKVGVTAGASTPQWVVDDVVSAIEAI
ncbi:MAG: 4-hydroxy-3-methylbut-2-enyl diphosphate reductase [Nitrospirae bacterium]|nr:4-hydroxy-3-methylbut-2-enyl diphosphate reductase [Nitrospirota bacterium]